MKQFLLIDDHEVVRSGVKSVITDIYRPCEVFEADNEATAVTFLKERQYDLVIMDVQIPDTDTGALMEYIRNIFPDQKVLMFSMGSENIYAKRFIKAGAMGFVSKNSGLEELKKAIDLVLNNKKYYSENLTDFLATQLGSNKVNNPFEYLTGRELDITTALMKGSSVTEIADAFAVSVSTASTYKARIFEKLKVKNIPELIEIGRVYNIA